MFDDGTRKYLFTLDMKTSKYSTGDIGKDLHSSAVRIIKVEV